MFFTIGERHGFTITKKTEHDKPYFVIGKDLEKNTLTVSTVPPKEEQGEQVVLDSVNFFIGSKAIGYWALSHMYAEQASGDNSYSVFLQGDLPICKMETQHKNGRRIATSFSRTSLKNDKGYLVI
jgi:tRNA U34 2-thiouridine synthase MnmA/TrmU